MMSLTALLFLVSCGDSEEGQPQALVDQKLSVKFAEKSSIVTPIDWELVKLMRGGYAKKPLLVDGKDTTFGFTVSEEDLEKIRRDTSIKSLFLAFGISNYKDVDSAKNVQPIYTVITIPIGSQRSYVISAENANPIAFDYSCPCKNYIGCCPPR